MLWAPVLGVWQVSFKAGSPRASPNVTQLAPLLKFLCSKEGRGWKRLRLLLSTLPASELLQAAIHLSLALFPCPGPALGAKLLQVFFKVLMVHGPVAGGLTVRLGDKSG